ncbi:phage tail tape measure protein, partial [Bacillus cereus]|nr:phage tail tape measure protein [Bacillus cereus]MEB8951379.1 phage tail tape measure protein [Bacillus cereus]MEB9263442.1 phage tail tape measure protein [Bacillus cereus]MEB9346366.1 phage tail tape measure protein [Bacillus cereus]MEB9751884.1 phage tail tape measure protein [Bacillus cereus]
VSVFVAGLQKLVDGFNSLPGPVQKAIAITGGIVLALTAVATVIGVIMGAIGMVVSGIGSLAIAMGVATAATSVTGAALGILTAVLGPVAIALGVVAAAVGVGVLAYKGYQKATEDSITSVDRFATNNKLAQDEYQKALASSDAATKKYMKQQTGEISSSTKKVLGDYFKLSDGIRQKLTEIKLNHEVMTTEQAQTLGQQYDQLTEKIITKVDERKQKETERLRKLFAD